MSWKRALMAMVARWDCMALQGPITLLFPELFLRAYYGCLKEDEAWGGKLRLTLSFDCDYEEDIRALPQILDMLSVSGLRASFACVGRWIESYPQEHAAILEGGHEILNHTHTHPDNEQLNPDHKFNQLSLEEQRHEIERCHRACQDLLGYQPYGFRTPHFGSLHTAAIYPLLAELGYKYSSSTLATRLPSFGQPWEVAPGVLEFPVTTCPKHPFAAFDTWHAIGSPRARHRRPGEFYKLFRRLVAVALERRAYLNFYLDPRHVTALHDFRAMLGFLSSTEGAQAISVETYLSLCEGLCTRRRALDKGEGEICAGGEAGSPQA